MGETTEAIGQRWYARVSPANDKEFVEVSGEAITISGWEHLDMCVHPAVSTMPVKDDECWTVTEGRSGCWVASGGSREVVIGKAQEYLNKRGREAVDALIAAVVEQYGPSPRARQVPEVQG